MKTNIFFLLLLLSFPALAYSLNIDDCEIGRTVYIDDWNDIEAEVIERDYSDNTVKIRIKETNETRWIDPSKLMGTLGKQVEDFAEDIAIDIGTRLLDCIMNKPKCNNTE